MIRYNHSCPPTNSCLLLFLLLFPLVFPLLESKLLSGDGGRRRLQGELLYVVHSHEASPIRKSVFRGAAFCISNGTKIVKEIALNK